MITMDRVIGRGEETPVADRWDDDNKKARQGPRRSMLALRR
jgi:hypothetical protein